MIFKPSIRFGIVGMALVLGASGFAASKSLLPGKTVRLARKQARLDKKLIQETQTLLDSAAHTKFGSRAALSRGTFDYLSHKNKIDLDQADVMILMQMVFFEASREANADLREMLSDMKTVMIEKKKIREMMERARDRKERLERTLRSQFESLAVESEKSPDLVFEPYRENHKVIYSPDSSASATVATGSGDVTVQVKCQESCSVEMRDLVKDQVLDTGRSGPQHGPVVLKGLVIGTTPVSITVKPVQQQPSSKKRVFDRAEMDIFYSRPTAGNVFQPKCREDGKVCKKLADSMTKLARLEGQLASTVAGIRLPETERRELARAIVEVVGRQLTIARRAENLILAGYVTPSEKAEQDSLAQLSEMRSLRLQQYMDRMTQADSAASNLMKKVSETTNQIVGNMK